MKYSNDNKTKTYIRNMLSDILSHMCVTQGGGLEVNVSYLAAFLLCGVPATAQTASKRISDNELIFEEKLKRRIC